MIIVTVGPENNAYTVVGNKQIAHQFRLVVSNEILAFTFCVDNFRHLQLTNLF